MPDTPKPKRSSPGRPALQDGKKRRIELFVNPTLAAHLEAEEYPEGPERRQIALRRKREAAEMLLAADIQSSII